MSLKRHDETWTEGTHVYFRNFGKMNGSRRNKITNTIAVLTKENEEIGTIMWFPKWRKYCFFPGVQTLYEETCLREISEYIETATREHKAKLRDSSI